MDIFPLDNNEKGFQALVKHLNKEDYVVMEASGPYYLPLAAYLHQEGYQVVIGNPLVIKGYSQIKLYRAKTDKKDAKTIAEYASSNPLKLGRPETGVITELKHLQTAIDGIQKSAHQTEQATIIFFESKWPTGCPVRERVTRSDQSA